MAIRDEFRYWYCLPERSQEHPIHDWRLFRRYLAVMLLVLAPFLSSEVQALTGIPLHRAAAFVALHVTLTAVGTWRRGYALQHLENAVMTALLPFVAAAATPVLWVFYLLSAINDAVLFRGSRFHALILAVLPWIMFGMSRATGALADLPFGVVLIVALLTPTFYLWVASVLDRYDSIVSQNRILLASASRQEERERISADLHDGVGANLTGLVLRCEMAREALRVEPGLASGILEEMERLSRDALRQVRLTVRSLVHEPLLPEEFGSTLRSIANEAAPGRTRITVNAGDSGRLSAELAYNLLLLSAEAINNSVRHGEAGSIDIVFTWTPAEWSLEVHDDGVGVGGSPNGRLPLRSIDRRAVRIGAEVDVRSHPGGGLGLLVRGLREPQPAAVSGP